MDEHVYGKLELTGSSKTSLEDAIQNAVDKASKTITNMRWFEVVDFRGYIENDKVESFVEKCWNWVLSTNALWLEAKEVF